MASHGHAWDEQRGDEQAIDGEHSDCEVPTEVLMMANYKKSRKNTLLEKKKMRNARVKRKRAARASSQATAKPPVRIPAGLTDTTIQKQTPVRECELQERKEFERKINLYKRMARSFWERWQWELKERKDATREKMLAYQKRSTTMINASPAKMQLNNINRTLLCDPKIQGKCNVLGQGSFGVVKLKTFRGINVAVKECFSRTVLSDVHHEANMLMQVCHPFLPYLFGICADKQPYCLVMQFHGITVDKNEFSCNINEAFRRNIITDGSKWLEICGQIMEALRYLHEEAQLLHNDITTSNILLTDSKTSDMTTSVHIVVIDFGKATTILSGRKYSLTECEKSEYIRRFPHLAPEVIHGYSAQSQWSDVYAAGNIFYDIKDAGVLTAQQADKLNSLASKCRLTEFFKRPSASKALGIIQTWLQ